MTGVASIDPRTGRAVQTVASETTVDGVDEICRAAAAAAPLLEAKGRAFRAELLRTLADALEADREQIVALADRETALGAPRLNGELTRTCYQLRLFADTVTEGGYLEATIDHAADTPMGPRPDLRRMLLPLGPVAVFGASNFPLAFSVPGGDTASALAAGCPVVVKAHPSHPATAQRCFEVMSAAAASLGAPAGILGIVHGQEAGAALVRHEVIRAVGFTGSLHGGQALAELCASRPEPIPFYGELASLNPMVVTPAAAAARAEQIATGLVGSFTLGAGQFCTKPGLVFVPDDAAGDQLRSAAAQVVSELDPQVLLNAGIQGSFAKRVDEIAAITGVQRIAVAGEGGADEGFAVRAALFATSASQFDAALTEECFGPVTVLVSYRDTAELIVALRLLPGSLTATVQLADGETELPSAVLDVLRDKAGRLLFNGYPTGVAVSWAQHHGGPWPATNTQHTSVGMTALRRFLRPVAWQDSPASLLPAELRDDEDVAIPRRIDGNLVAPQ